MVWQLGCEVEPVFTTEWECSTGWHAVERVVFPVMSVSDAALIGGAIISVWVLAWAAGVVSKTLLRRY